MKKFIIFDLDDVLYDFDAKQRTRDLSANCHLSPKEIEEKWLKSGWEDRAESGEFANGDAFLAAFNKLLETNFTREFWVKVRANALKPIEKSLEAARELKSRGHELAILTNNGALVHEEFSRLVPEAFELFGENAFSSWFFEARKPNILVFQNILKHFRFEPRDTIFIDDRLENISGANLVGINTIHFQKELNLVEVIDDIIQGRPSAL